MPGFSGISPNPINSNNAAEVRSILGVPSTSEMNAAIAHSTATIETYSIDGSRLYAQKIGRLVILTIYDFKVSEGYTVTLNDGYKPKVALNAVVASKGTDRYVGIITIGTNGVLTVNFPNYPSLYYGIVAYFV